METGYIQLLDDNIVPLHNNAKLAKHMPKFKVFVLKGFILDANGFSEGQPLRGIAEILAVYGLNHPWINSWLNTSKKETIVYDAEFTKDALATIFRNVLKKGIPASLVDNACLVIGPAQESTIRAIIDLST